MKQITEEERKRRLKELKNKHGSVTFHVKSTEAQRRYLRELRLWEKYGKKPNDPICGPRNDL